MICTNSKLVEAVSKLVVFGLDRYVDVADVYSSEKVGKSSVYDRIKKKYGEKNSYVVVGTLDSKEQAQKVRFSNNLFHNGFELFLVACLILFLYKFVQCCYKLNIGSTIDLFNNYTTYIFNLCVIFLFK